MKRRLLSVLLVVAMLLSMVPAAFAAEAGEEAAAPHNYVGNGSFEDPNAIWNYSSVWKNAAVVTDDPSAPVCVGKSRDNMA